VSFSAQQVPSVQLRKQIEDAGRLNEERRNLAFGSAKADIDQQYNEMAEQLRASREKMEACNSSEGYAHACANPICTCLELA
jgi:hypothetical protein